MSLIIILLMKKLCMVILRIIIEHLLKKERKKYSGEINEIRARFVCLSLVVLLFVSPGLIPEGDSITGTNFLCVLK